MKRLIFVFLLFPALLWAQNIPKKSKKNEPPGKLSLRIEESSKGAYFVLEAELPYPDGVVFVIELRHVEGNTTLGWYRVTLKKRRFFLKTKPFRKTLLPGRYAALLWFRMTDQPVHIRNFLRAKFGFSLQYSRDIDGIVIQHGSPEEIQKTRRKVLGQHLKFIQQIEELLEECHKKSGWKDSSYKERKPPSLEEWKSVKKDLAQRIREFNREMDFWKNQYISVEKSAWISQYKRFTRRLLFLLNHYTQLIKLENSLKAEEREKDPKVKSLRNLCLSFGKIIQKRLRHLKISIQHILNPPKEPQGEEGVE